MCLSKKNQFGTACYKTWKMYLVKKILKNNVSLSEDIKRIKNEIPEITDTSWKHTISMILN